MKHPGWIDLQINGATGYDFSDPNLTEDQIMAIIDYVFNSGTECFLPTIVTNPIDIYKRNPALIKRVVEKHGLLDRIPGIHFEGPFISPGAVGAHKPECLQVPSAQKIHELYDMSEGFFKMLTLGADVENAVEGIKEARKLGVIVSVGHHTATTEDVRRAADAGAQTLTHLGNGVANMIDRHHNPIWAGLAEDRLTAMIITDGHHLPLEVIKIFVKCKGADKIIVTSDAIMGAGLPPGKYHTFGNDAVLEPNGKFWNPSKNCLVGSTSMMSGCMKVLESLNILSEEELVKVGRLNQLALLNGK